MASSYSDKLKDLMKQPIIPQRIEEDKLENPVAFPDADATEEEIREYLEK